MNKYSINLCFFCGDDSRPGLLTILLLAVLVLPLPADNLRVSPAGPFTGIQEAIHNARQGDTITVDPGIYRETDIIIDKPLTLLGHNWPEIDGENKNRILTVRANNVHITGLVIKNAGISFIEDNAGLLLENVRNCVVENNRFLNNFFAVYLSQSADCRVTNNTVVGQASRESSSGNGIHLWYCKNIILTDNHIRNHRDGIYFEFVRSGMVTGNVSEYNLRYGLHFMFSDSCQYSGNVFRKNGAGVAVMYTHNVLMFDNRFENNWGPASYGLLLKEISNSHIYNNTFHQNSTALYSEACSRNLVKDNLFIQNGWAVKLMANSMDNLFTGNQFESNSFDVATNSRQNFNTFNMNYWSAYNGYDLNHDGIGDIPYRPVSLFSFLVEQHPPGLILLKSFFIQLLEIAERIMPVLTPETLLDQNPLIRISS